LISVPGPLSNWHEPGAPARQRSPEPDARFRAAEGRDPTIATPRRRSSGFGQPHDRLRLLSMRATTVGGSTRSTVKAAAAQV
jgi:hypothetical protein